MSAMLPLLCPHQSPRRFMNLPSSSSPSSPTTANPELLRKLVQEFQPNPHRVLFRNLEPFRDSIETLREKGASYAIIAELLREHGVKTSRARVAEYGRTVLEKQKPRKRRRRTNPAPFVTPPAIPQTPTASVLPTNPPGSFPSSYQRPRGPHIAKVRMLDGTTT